MSTGRNRNRGGALADINITPLVDVLLVLLIIFMVTAPLIHHGAVVPTPDMSPSDATPSQKDDEKDTLLVDHKGNIKLHNQPVPLKELYKRIQADTKLQRTKELYIRAHLDLNYGKVMEIIGTMRKAGIRKLGVVVYAEELNLPPLPKDALPKR